MTYRQKCSPIAMLFTIASLYMIFAMEVVFGDDGNDSGGDDDGDDDASGDKACPMEIRYHSSFETCYESTSIANAIVYADGKCHTVESNVSPSDANYSILPGNYRLECESDGKTLVFLDSACQEGTCTQDGTCSSDVSQPGSLFGRVPGQLVQDPSVGDNYVCETLFDDDYDYEIFFAIFGDCSLPGCSVGGSINPTPAEPTNPPVQAPQPTAKPVAAPTDAPQSTTPVPVPSTPEPPTQAPMVNEPPTTRAPIEIPPVNVTAAPVLIPTAAPILVAAPTTLPTRVPTSDAPVIVVTPPTTATTTPTASPDPPSASPQQNIRTPSPTARPTRAPTNALTQASSSDGNNNSVLILGAIGGTISVIVVMLLWWCFVVRKQSKSVDSKNGALATTTTNSSEKTNQLRLGPDDLQNHDRLLGNTATNEIWIDPSRDDVSTLDGGTLPEMIRGAGGDEATASINMDFDFGKNQYRFPPADEERSRWTSSTAAFTTLSKLGIRGSLDANADDDDDLSFDRQFADTMDDEEIMTAVGSMNWSRASGHVRAAAAADMAHRIRPFEVRVPPGMLGLVMDSPNGSVPVIRAIKPSSVLYPQVQVGDRLISVDHENVTNMSAIQVSNLITQKQDQHRVFVFCRLLSEIQQNS